MAIKGVNRFALLGNDDNSSSSGSDPPSPREPDTKENGWQEVKPRAKQTPKLPVKMLVLRDETQHGGRNLLAVKTNVHNNHNHGFVAAGTRTVSGSSDGTDRFHNPNENWCGVCQQKFPTKHILQTHIKQTPKHENYCNLCQRVFKNRNGLKNHVDNSLDHDIFCNLCLSAFKDKWGLKNHFENNYAVGHKFVCLTCLMGFKSQNEMDRHFQTARKHVRCDTCHRNFRGQDERDEHWVKTTKHKHCLQPGCEFDAPDLNVLDKHLKEDHHQCEACHLIFPSRTKLMAHNELCDFNIPCDRCGITSPGQNSLAVHQESCFSCDECHYHTTHEENYQIHMTKHTSATLACWACEIPMCTASGLINHLESGKCPRFPDSSILIKTLGAWWYSPLYMDLDLHAQIRTGRIDVKVLQHWISEGSIQPFICRAHGCGKAFAHFSSLVLHVESQACEWDVPRLGFEMLRREVVGNVRRDSVME